MERKEFWVPLAVLGLTAVFATVSLLVRLSRGNTWLIRRKLAVGAMLLSLTWAASGCGEDGGGGIVTCYAPGLPDNTINFDHEQFTDEGLLLDLSLGSIITGSVEQRTADAFAFLITDDDVTVFTGIVTAVDGAYDATDEAIQLDVGNALAPGRYRLTLAPGTPETISLGEGYAVWLTVVAPSP